MGQRRGAAVVFVVLLAVTLVAVRPVGGPRASATTTTWPSAAAATSALGRGVQIVTPVTNHPTGGEQIDAAEGAAIAVAGGFDSVRFAVPFERAAGPGPDFVLDPGFLAAVDADVDAFLDAGLTVVLENVGGINSADQLAAMWAQIAAHFADRPPQVYFELANEPVWTGGGLIPDFSSANVLGPDEWNDVVAEVLPVVRATNPERTVVITAADIAHPQAVPELELPDDDDHLVVTFHQYQPLELTHQGAGWLPGADEWLGTTWSGTADEVASLAATMAPAVCWARSTGRPLWISEFGTFAAADESSRVAWTRAVADLAEAEGMAWTYFELSSGGFGFWDRAAGDWRRPLLDALTAPRAVPAPWADCDAPERPVPAPGTCAPAGELHPSGLALITTPAAAAIGQAAPPFEPTIAVDAPEAMDAGEVATALVDIELDLGSLVTSTLEQEVRPVVRERYGDLLAAGAWVTMSLSGIDAELPAPGGGRIVGATMESSSIAAVVRHDATGAVLELGSLDLDSRVPGDVVRLLVEVAMTAEPGAAALEMHAGALRFDLDLGIGIALDAFTVEGHLAGPWRCTLSGEVLATTTVRPAPTSSTATSTTTTTTTTTSATTGASTSTTMAAPVGRGAPSSGAGRDGAPSRADSSPLGGDTPTADGGRSRAGTAPAPTAPAAPAAPAATAVVAAPELAG